MHVDGDVVSGMAAYQLMNIKKDKPAVTYFKICVLNSLHGKKSLFLEYVIVKSSGI